MTRDKRQETKDKKFSNSESRIENRELILHLHCSQGCLADCETEIIPLPRSREVEPGRVMPPREIGC